MIKKINALPPGKKVFFASDFHLGSPSAQKSLEREKKICAWMDKIKEECEALFLMGDLFDFWYEYRSVIPKGFIRFQGKLAEYVDADIPIYIFAGNHDIWLYGYFTEELGIPILRKPQEFEVGDKKFYLAHGDGLGPGDLTYKFLKKVFESKVCQWLFSRIHPNLGFWLATGWSAQSRKSHNEKESSRFRGEKEWLIVHSREIENQQHHDFYVFGHRHFPIEYPLSDKAKYVNLGEWFDKCSFGVFDGKDLCLNYYTTN